MEDSEAKKHPKTLSKIRNFLSRRSTENKSVEVEIKRDGNRVVVYGSNSSGAGDLSIALQEYFKKEGIENPNVQQIRDATTIYQAFYGELEGHSERTLPRGVILFPQMRQYTPTGSGMMINAFKDGDGKGRTIADHIVQLCNENEVPYFKVEQDVTPDQLKDGVGELFPNPPKSLHGE